MTKKIRKLNVVILVLVILTLFGFGSFISKSFNNEEIIFPESIEKINQELFEEIQKLDEEKLPLIIKVKDDVNKTLKNYKIRKVSRRSAVVDVNAENVNEIVESDDVEKIYPNFEYSILVENSVPFLGVPIAWQNNKTGFGIKVAVLDTGINGLNVVASKTFTGDSSTDDGNGHGSHVAGIVAAVAPNVSLLNAKVLKDDGTGSSFSIANGIDWAVEQEVDVISLSLGAPNNNPDDYLREAIDRAINQDIIVVVASGNCGQGCGDYYGVTNPGYLESVITVGSIGYDYELSSFSSYNDNKPDVVAPGENIDVNGVIKSGTSMATPHISGIAALIGQGHESFKQFIKENSVDLGDEGKDEFGWGWLNVSGLFEVLNESVNETVLVNETVDVNESLVNETDKINESVDNVSVVGENLMLNNSKENISYVLDLEKYTILEVESFFEEEYLNNVEFVTYQSNDEYKVKLGIIYFEDEYKQKSFLDKAIRYTDSEFYNNNLVFYHKHLNYWFWSAENNFVWILESNLTKVEDIVKIYLYSYPSISYSFIEESDFYNSEVNPIEISNSEDLISLNTGCTDDCDGDSYKEDLTSGICHIQVNSGVKGKTHNDEEVTDKTDYCIDDITLNEYYFKCDDHFVLFCPGQAFSCWLDVTASYEKDCTEFGSNYICNDGACVAGCDFDPACSHTSKRTCYSSTRYYTYSGSTLCDGDCGWSETGNWPCGDGNYCSGTKYDGVKPCNSCSSSCDGTCQASTCSGTDPDCKSDGSTVDCCSDSQCTADQKCSSNKCVDKTCSDYPNTDGGCINLFNTQCRNGDPYDCNDVGAAWCWEKIDTCESNEYCKDPVGTPGAQCFEYPCEVTSNSWSHSSINVGQEATITVNGQYCSNSDTVTIKIKEVDELLRSQETSLENDSFESMTPIDEVVAELGTFTFTDNKVTTKWIGTYQDGDGYNPQNTYRISSTSEDGEKYQADMVVNPLCTESANCPNFETLPFCHPSQPELIVKNVTTSTCSAGECDTIISIYELAGTCNAYCLDATCVECRDDDDCNSGQECNSNNECVTFCGNGVCGSGEHLYNCEADCTPSIVNYEVLKPSMLQTEIQTFKYEINNPSSISVEIGLGASINLNSDINDPNHDDVVSVSSGTNWYTRSFNPSDSITPGIYDAIWGIYKVDSNDNFNGMIESKTQLDAFEITKYCSWLDGSEGCKCFSNADCDNGYECNSNDACVEENNCDIPNGESADCDCDSNDDCDEFGMICNLGGGYDACIEYNEPDECGVVDNYYCGNGNVYRCEYENERKVMKLSDTCTENEVCPSNVNTLHQCQNQLDYDLIIESASSGTIVNKQRGDRLRINVKVSSAGNLNFNYDGEDFYYIGGPCDSNYFNAGDNWCEFYVIGDNKQYSFSVADDEEIVNVISNPYTLYVTNLPQLKRRFSDKNSVEVLMSKVYEEAQKNLGLVYDLDNYIGEKHPFDYNFVRYLEPFIPNGRDNTYAFETIGLINSKCKGCKEIIIVGDDYVVPKFEKTVSIRDGFFSGINPHNFLTDDVYTINNNPNFNNLDLAFSNKKILIVKPDDVHNSELNNLKSSLVDIYGKKDLTVPPMGKKCDTNMVKETYVPENYVCCTCEEGNQYVEDEDDIEVVNSQDLSCDDFGTLGYKTLIILGNKDNNPLFSCIKDTHDISNSVQIRRNIWSKDDDFAILINGDLDSYDRLIKVLNQVVKNGNWRYAMSDVEGFGVLDGAILAGSFVPYLESVIDIADMKNDCSKVVSLNGHITQIRFDAGSSLWCGFDSLMVVLPFNARWFKSIDKADAVLDLARRTDNTNLKILGSKYSSEIGYYGSKLDGVSWNGFVNDLDAISKADNFDDLAKSSDRFSDFLAGHEILSLKKLNLDHLDNVVRIKHMENVGKLTKSLPAGEVSKLVKNANDFEHLGTGLKNIFDVGIIDDLDELRMVKEGKITKLDAAELIKSQGKLAVNGVEFSSKEIAESILQNNPGRMVEWKMGAEVMDELDDVIVQGIGVDLVTKSNNQFPKLTDADVFAKYKNSDEYFVESVKNGKFLSKNEIINGLEKFNSQGIRLKSDYRKIIEIKKVRLSLTEEIVSNLGNEWDDVLNYLNQNNMDYKIFKKVGS